MAAAPRDSDQSDTKAQRWRGAFQLAYLLFTSGVTLWTLGSVALVHCGRHDHHVPFRGRKISASGDNPNELRRCHRDLKRLLVDLHKETFALQAKTLQYRIDPGVEWRNWSQAWRHRWAVTERRCRLTELGGRGVSSEIDAMQRIHQQLDELQISYTGVMDRFVERYVERLRGLSRELDGIRTTIDRRAKGR